MEPQLLDTFNRLNIQASKVGTHITTDTRGYKIIRTETGKPLYERIPTLVRVRTLIHQIPPRRLR